MLTATASAQSLNTLIQTALENNYQIQILRNQSVIAKNNNTAGNAGQLPSVDLNGSYTLSYNNTLQKFSDGTQREGDNAKNTAINGSALANWTAFNGFMVYAKKDQLGLLEELGETNTRYYIEQTVSDIVMAYNQLLYESNLLKNYKNSLAISSFRLTLEKKRREVGAGTYLDYGQALVDYQTDSIRFLSQENTVQSLNIEINRVIGQPLEQSINVIDTTYSMLPIASKSVLIENIKQNNSQFDVQRIQELLAETDLRMQKASRAPKINLFAGYQYSRSVSEVGFFNSNQNYGPTIGVSISYNLFNGGATNRAIKNSKILLDNSDLTTTDVSQNLNADVLNLYNEYLSISKRIQLAQSNVDAMQKVYTTAEQQLKKGAINGYDFRSTQLTLLNSEMVIQQLNFSLKTIEINLKRLSGSVLEAYL